MQCLLITMNVCMYVLYVCDSKYVYIYICMYVCMYVINTDDINNANKNLSICMYVCMYV